MRQFLNNFILGGIERREGGEREINVAKQIIEQEIREILEEDERTGHGGRYSRGMGAGAPAMTMAGAGGMRVGHYAEGGGRGRGIGAGAPAMAMAGAGTGGGGREMWAAHQEMTGHGKGMGTGRMMGESRNEKLKQLVVNDILSRPQIFGHALRMAVEHKEISNASEGDYNSFNSYNTFTENLNTLIDILETKGVLNPYVRHLNAISHVLRILTSEYFWLHYTEVKHTEVKRAVMTLYNRENAEAIVSIIGQELRNFIENSTLSQREKEELIGYISKDKLDAIKDAIISSSRR